MAGRSLTEKILSAKSGTKSGVGDIVVCEADLVIGTDGSTPMAIDVFEQMYGRTVTHPERVLLSRDHYAPATSQATRGYHCRMETFASAHGIELLGVGDGIGFQVALEIGMVHPGDLVIGADSHTVTCGAVGAFATGIGSTDLAAAFLTGEVWLRVPETIRVVLDGNLPAAVRAKDVALEVVRRLGPNGATYSALEFVGQVAADLSVEERMVISNMSVETGAKAGIFPTSDWCSDEKAGIAKEIRIDCTQLEPKIALPHNPSNGVPVTEAVGMPIDWVFLGTCTGGFANDLREALLVLTAGGGIAEGVTVIVTPPSSGVRDALEQDGTLDRLEALGVVITETGCGPCCGTSEPVPPPKARILSTANRNFHGRMGEASAKIHLASPITCAAAATAGHVVDPRGML
jgi:3-isopropylmalate/(R)-2-methylmalate dehydratase large subunit